MIHLTQKLRHNKYGNKKTAIDGFTFDSHAEAHYYLKLRALEKAGEISDLRVHPVFTLQSAFTRLLDGKKERAITYEGDFLIMQDGKRVCIDVKGVETALFKVKAKMFRKRYPETELRVVKGGRQ